MADFFPITLFPNGALSSSVITTVWVGIFVVVMLNLRFGTTLSGLVVPGYLVPLIILRPMSASVILMEGIFTYWIAVVLAERLPKWLSYSEIFGRDRFFALVLISVIVRLIFDGFLLPELGEYLLEHGFDYDYRNNLHSFGLIIVALIANQMWNGGIRKGITSLILYVGISYFIIRWILMEYTNFNISTMSYMYEDLASSILASPKAYIILLTSAFIASRMNLRYGWEFNGILIPSLLALQWYQPEKLIITLLEAIIIYLVAIAVLNIRIFKSMHVEGPRQILLFFNISFIYKLALGFILTEYFPNQKVSDYYAFGYLLSTLLAIKMYQKDIAILMARATFQTSLSAVIVASIIGFILTLVPTSFREDPVPINASTTTADINHISENFDTYFGKLRSKLYTSEESTKSGQANPIELDDIRSLFTYVKSYLVHSNENNLDKIVSLSNKLKFNTSILNEHYLILEDSQPDRGWGLYIFDLTSKSSLMIEVPAPLDEPQASDAASSLFKTLSAKGLVLAGKRRMQSSDGTSDTLKNSQTPFQMFHQILGSQNTLQVRQYTQLTGRRLLGVRSQNLVDTLNIDNNQIWIKRTIPTDLDINLLSSMLDNLEINWRYAPLENRQQDTSPKGFSELFLSPSGVKQILSFSSTGPLFSEKIQTQRIDGYLLSWIKNNKALIAKKGSNAYRPAELYEMLFIDQNIVSPIMNMINGDLVKGWNDESLLEIHRINNLALSVNYELIRYHHKKSGEDFLILQERSTNQLRHWGTYVFRLGPANPFLIEVSRPLSEVNTLEFGSALFEKLKARALLISGTHPFSNTDGSANLLHNVNKVNLFNLMHQAILRESRNESMMVIQMRAFSNQDNTPNFNTDLLIAKLGVTTVEHPALISSLEAVFKDNNLRYQYVLGDENSRGYEVSWNAQARYSPMTNNKPFFVVWVSPAIRSTFFDQSDSRQLIAKFKTLGIYSEFKDVASWASTTSQYTQAHSNIDISLIQDFLITANIVSLKYFIDDHTMFSFKHFIDINTQQSYLAISDKNESLIALVNLRTHNESRKLITGGDAPSLRDTQEFIDGRARWLTRTNIL